MSRSIWSLIFFLLEKKPPACMARNSLAFCQLLGDNFSKAFDTVLALLLSAIKLLCDILKGG